MSVKENKYQAYLIKKIYHILPDCIILKNDPNYLQGIADLSIFYNDRWAMLEVKADEKAEHQPNQDYYIKQANDMSFAAFIFPENEEYILKNLTEWLKFKEENYI